MDLLTETELLTRARAGSLEAFEQVLQPYLPMLFAYSRAICGDFHAAEDAVQETALVAYRNIHHFFPESDFGTWLRAIARRRALEARRKLGRVQLVDEELIERVYQEPLAPEEDRRRDALAECLKRLAGRMGQLVQGHYFQGASLGELAQTLSMTPSAAKQLLYRSRLHLKDCVEQRLAVEDAR
jgi:RNA polymerase sigma-70 factor (ECF subfamily)